MKKYTCVFIDLDDTLWDFRTNAYLSLQDMYAKYELKRYFGSFEHFFRLYTFRNKQLWERYNRNEITKEYLHKERFLYPFRQVHANTTEDFSEKIGHDFLMTTTTKPHLIPFAKELLEYLQPKYRLSLVSNGFSEVQHRKISNSHLDHFFDHIILSEDVGCQKPDKRFFDFVLQQNNVPADEAIMIGDNPETDIAGARNSGIDQILYHPNTLKTEIQATFTVKSLEEITKIL